ncbi:TRAP transporter small permease subunit [Natronospirillum operosum]|uniref:TRAP transporter small permease protein n=2 Tax=Natronospirillum operosum TaxID=2759953 RepID=A0A4Z0WGI9_9GAMM|nr:TRAP transporter small permease subunit [Natronospirillum operosum]
MVQAIVPGAVEARQDLPTNIISRPVDAVIRFIGQLAAWLWVATIAVITINVVDRFMFGRGSIALEELSWHFFGAAMLLSLSYAVVTDDHVRVDFLRERFSLKTRAWIELLALVLLAMPVFWIVLEETYSYAMRSYVSGERSQAPSGLPNRFIIKGAMPLGFTLLMLAFASRALRCISFLFGFPRPFWPHGRGPVSDNAEQSSGGA